MYEKRNRQNWEEDQCYFLAIIMTRNNKVAFALCMCIMEKNGPLLLMVKTKIVIEKDT
jgi:hypothetical protein